MVVCGVAGFVHDRHAVESTRTGRKGEVVSWCSRPPAVRVHQEGEVLAMVIPVMGKHVEDGKTVHGSDVRWVEGEFVGDDQHAFIIKAGVAEVIVDQSAKGMNVATPSMIAVEAFGAKIPRPEV